MKRHKDDEEPLQAKQDAIFAHDRGAVCLPRKLPKKMVSDGCKINAALMNEETELEVWLASEECQCEEQQPPAEEIPLPIFTEEEIDDEVVLYMKHSDERIQRDWFQIQEAALARAAVDDLCLECEQIDCACNESNVEVAEVYNVETDDAEESDSNALMSENERGSSGDKLSDEDSASTYEEKYDSDGYVIPPARCMKGHGTFGALFDSCEFCGGYELKPNQDEEAYVDSDSNDDDPLEEDEEHFDSAERKGMLFYTFEPGILLACKEIREQRLPIYYGMNAFSWRFFWQSPRRSRERVIEWTEVVGENTEHIRKISFESRHAVEEGIEFEVDIDLLDRAPFYEVKAYCNHPGDELTEVTVEAIEQDFLAVLHNLSRRYGGVIEFSADDIGLLGRVFLEATRRDPGVAGDIGQWN